MGDQIICAHLLPPVAGRCGGEGLRKGFWSPPGNQGCNRAGVLWLLEREWVRAIAHQILRNKGIFGELKILRNSC